jgi:hypothetical protein
MYYVEYRKTANLSVGQFLPLRCPSTLMSTHTQLSIKTIAGSCEMAVKVGK